MPGLGFTTTVAATSADLPPGVRMDSASTAHVNEKPKLDPSDPRVRKLVYSMYRGMLTTFNGEANDIISKKDPAKVTHDSGIGPILESIVLKQRGLQGGGGDSSEPPPSSEGQPESESTASNDAETVAMPPPPPPPPMMPGSLPTVRLNSEIGPRDRGPPAALAGAMMKDKKPFTYTPGGIDLSEIRSPRMAKRIQMNARAEGVCNTPTPSSSNQERPPCHLPPAALAAMQPQMAIPVFPQGNIAKPLNRSHRPSDYNGPPPPPPPMPAPVMAPPPVMPSPVVTAPPMITLPVAAPPSPQPVVIRPTTPVSPTSPKSPQTPPITKTPPPPPERASTPKSPVPPVDSYLGNSRPSSQTSYLEELKSSMGRKSPNAEATTGVGTGCIYIPPIQSPPPPPPPAPFAAPLSPYAPSSRPAGQTKAQAVSQNIGSIYIPPIGSMPNTMDAQPSVGGGNGSNGSANISRIPQSAQATPLSAPIPAAPQLNKAPVPWMNSYNRMQNQTDSPPYVHPGYFMPPPWGPPPGARTIPIMMPRESDQIDAGSSDSRPSSAGSGSSTPTGSRTPSQAATHLGRVIPIQIEREDAMRQKGAKIIPIQIEGRPPRGAQTPSTPATPMVNPMRRVVGPPPYNSPMGMYSNQNVMDAYQRQASEAAAGVDRMAIRCESPRTDPAQSKSMRIIQQAAENELKRYEQEQQQHRLEMSEDDRCPMGLFKSQVDEGSFLHQTTEPRFLGSHIPSKAFRALQTALPATPGAQDQPPPSYPAAQPGQVHHIPIRQVSQSPTPQSLASEIQVNSQTNLPPSEQKVQEPKKYMGSNIPSRSFKILQAMTADDGQSETVSSEQNSADSYDDTISPCPTTENVPLSPCSSQSSYPIYLSYSSEDGGSSTFDPYNPCSQNPWPDIMDQGWDPYSYMWYYWWYYSSCYWAGYDMTGYEYPPGWDPNYPYCPPELFGDYSTLSEYTSGGSSDQCNLGDTNDAPSDWSGTDLHKSLAGNEVEAGYYEHDNDSGRMPSENNTLPRIVVEEGELGKEGKYCQDRENNVDSIKDNNNSNNNDGSTNKAPNPLTECNQKPGNPIPYKRNDCDSVGEKTFWKGEQENFAECKQLQNGNDNDENEEGRDESEHEDSSSEDEFESCCEDEQKVIERETGPCNKLFVNQRPDHFSGTEQKSREREFEFHGNYNSELNANDDHHRRKDEKRKGVGEEDDDEDEKTDPGADDDDDEDDYGGRIAIIEEPETLSSADDSDGAPLVNEHQRAGKSSAFYSNGGLSIEEYHSEESSDSAVFDYGLKKNRLSTIDEITESRASSSLFSRNLSAELDCCANTSNSPNENSGLLQIDAKGESEDSDESSEDELSSVSVIENKSDATRGTESKREDETTSSSEEDSSTDDDDDADDDDDDAGAADTAVTVRLPLKLCFTKTKSYRDITTVMVGDSEIEKTGTQEITEDVRSRGENEPIAQGNNVDEEDDNAPNFPDTTEDIEDDEPVVSFTLSLSRQTSRSDDESPKSEATKGCSENAKNNNEDEAADIDFWATIKSDESETTSSITVRFSPTAEVTTGGNPRANVEEESCKADVDFWGVIARDGSATNIHRIRKENVRGSNRCVSYHEPSSQDDQWDPYESIDYKWEQDFNFWEKSSRTMETRRFSSNFEITEDYESDSGLKPSSKRERVKKYTHHKRHSIPGPGWDRSSLPPRSAPAKQPTSLSKPPSPNEQETRDGKGSSGNNESGSERTSSSNGQTVDASQDDTDASSWWSYWDEVSKKNEEKSENNEERAYIRVEKAEPGVGTPTESRTEDIVESQREESYDISVEIKLSDAERNSTGESCTEDDYQSFAYMQTSRSEERGSGGFSSLERKDSEVKDRKSLNHSCQSDATTVTTDNDDYSSSPEIKSSPLFPTAANQEAEKLIQASSACISVSDENSDESSSRSSGTTIGRHDKSEIKKQPLSTPLISPAPAADEKADSECLLKSSTESTLPVDTSIQIPVSIERTVEIHQELGERMKLNGKQQQQDELQHAACTGSINTSSSCTCLMGDRIARAENLLWRIERFLHESLSLGSEDDSGVMTDLSRQISDVDTDVDNDLNETEFLLTAAAAAKERRGMASKDSQHIESCNFAETISSTDTPSQQPSTSPLPTSAQVKKPRPKSDIILESSLTKLETETVEENNGVKMRSASERRALRYQRAKTHSRLFQLLQDECGGRDEEQDEFDYDSDVGTPTKGTILSPTHFATEGLINVESSTVQSIHVDTSSGTATHSHSSCNNGMDDHSHNGMSPGMNDAQARRSRLLPLPIKNLLASSLSLDSNSSPSGSSGVLSPTSPVNRDQLLADIINEFHVRNQVSTLRAQSQRRISSSFPSKIFKLLQHEFGEEFYQTFDCCGGGGGGGEDSLISPCMSTNLCVNDSTSLASISQAAAGAAVVHECTIHKSESMKEFEEATNRILTNIMLRNKQKASACQPNSESPSSTATMSSQLLQDDSKKTSADFLEVPMRKKKANLTRDPRSPKSTKKS